MRNAYVILICLLGAMLSASLIPSRIRGGDAENGSEAKEASDGGLSQLREGAELTSVLGEFYRVGARYEFRPFDIDVGLTCLENLALDRVSRVYEETRSSRVWAASGLVTEQRSNYYLLLSKAVIVNQRDDGQK